MSILFGLLGVYKVYTVVCMKKIRDQILAGLPKDKPKRERRSIFVDPTLYSAFEKTVGKGKVSRAIEDLMRLVVEKR